MNTKLSVEAEVTSQFGHLLGGIQIDTASGAWSHKKLHSLLKRLYTMTS